MPSSPRIDEIWELHDAHRTADVGDPVTIDGLVSDAGRPLNGTRGRVVDKVNDRLAVELANSTRKHVKPCNLKTLGGIVRTNSFEYRGQSLLYKLLCRVNCACGPAANVTKVTMDGGVAYVMTTKEIKKGEEILIDYLPGESGVAKRELLRVKYNF